MSSLHRLIDLGLLDASVHSIAEVFALLRGFEQVRSEAKPVFFRINRFAVLQWCELENVTKLQASKYRDLTALELTDSMLSLSCFEDAGSPNGLSPTSRTTNAKLSRPGQRTWKHLLLTDTGATN